MEGSQKEAGCRLLRESFFRLPGGNMTKWRRQRIRPMISSLYMRMGVSLFDKDHPLETSIDTEFSLDQINDALAKVRRGGSKGKTIIKVHESEH